MYKITNIGTLGTNYSVADKNGKLIKHIQVIPHTEILDAALGVYDEATHDLASYMEKSVALLEGNEDISHYDVYWYATEKENIDLTEVIDHAIKHRYDIVIIEHLEPTLH